MHNEQTHPHAHAHTSGRVSVVPPHALAEEEATLSLDWDWLAAELRDRDAGTENECV